jgi:hypothetical protein
MLGLHLSNFYCNIVYMKTSVKPSHVSLRRSAHLKIHVYAQLFNRPFTYRSLRLKMT